MKTTHYRVTFIAEGAHGAFATCVTEFVDTSKGGAKAQTRANFPVREIKDVTEIDPYKEYPEVSNE